MERRSKIILKTCSSGLLFIYSEWDHDIDYRPFRKWLQILQEK